MERGAACGERADQNVPVEGGDALAEVAEALAAGPWGRVREPHAVVGDVDDQASIAEVQPHVDVVGACVLDDVGEGFADGEVRRALHLARQPPPTQTPSRPHGDLGGVAPSPRLDGCEEPAVGEHLRVDAVCEFAQFVQHARQLAAHGLEHLRDAGADRCASSVGVLVAVEVGASAADLADQGDQVLLDAVVQVTLDAPALLLLRPHESYARVGELSGPLPQLRDAFGELGRQPDVADGQRRLPCEIPHRRPVVFVQGTAQLRPAPQVATDIAFAPSELRTEAGPVSILVRNTDPGRHTFTIEELELDVEVPAASTQRIEFVATPGTYDVTCSVPGHEEMKATFVVRA